MLNTSYAHGSSGDPYKIIATRDQVGTRAVLLVREKGNKDPPAVPLIRDRLH